MYHLGGFPGIKLDGNPDGFVGDILELTDPDVLQQLDGYEGYNPEKPEHSLYLRRLIEIPGHGEVMIYEYNDRIAGRARVEGGDWTTQ